MEKLERKIIDALLSTNRVGIKNLTEHMQRCGFFTSPASGKYHGAYEGGLAEHSWNVYVYAHKLAKELLPKEEYLQMKNSITLVSLLHDLGKMGDFGKPNYIPNMVKAKTKDKETGEYFKVQSDAEPFKHNPELGYLDHEVTSSLIARQFIRLTEEEQIAIIWHNGLYGIFKYEIPNHETKLYLILHTADMWASRVVEKDN